MIIYDVFKQMYEIVYMYWHVYIYIYIYICETCVWTPNKVFFAIIVVESQGLPTMKCQRKCAKGIRVVFC